MKISEVKVIKEAAPTNFVPTHYGGIGGSNSVMVHTDGNLYFRSSDGIVRWNGNPTGEGFLGKWNPATIKGRIVDGQKVPYGPGENFGNDPTARPGGATADAAPAASTQNPRPVTGASYDQGLLRKGSRGEGVKELQRRLGMSGDDVDGIFGPKTEAAVKKLQQSQGIKVDGIVGPETRSAIEKLQAPEDNSAPEQTPPEPTDPTPPEPETPEEPGTPSSRLDTKGETPEPAETPTTQRSAREIWNTIKDMRDALPQGPERVRLSNLMNQINVSTTTPEEAEEILARAEEISPSEPEDETPSAPEDETPSAPETPAPSGRVEADTIRDRLSPEAQEKFDDQLQEFNGDLLRMLVDAKNQADDFLQRGSWRSFYEEVFGITVSGGRVEDDPTRGVIDISSIPNIPRTRRRGAAQADTGALLGQIRYKTIDDMEESRILDLAGVKMKKKLDEASININGADASEVAEILRMMQLAGADGAKMVEPDDINPGPKPCPICGKVHGPSQPMGGCGSKPKEPGMGDMIRLMSPEESVAEENEDGGFEDATTEPDEEMTTYANDMSASIPAGNDLHKEKGSYPATAGGDNPMNTEEAELEETIKSQLLAALAQRKK